MTRMMPADGLPEFGALYTGQPLTDCSWCGQPLTRYRRLPLCIDCDLIPHRALHPTTEDR